MEVRSTASGTGKKARVERGSSVYKESLRNIVLRILADGPRHGYEIMKRIEEITNGRWRPAAGTLYPLLEQMRYEGLIEIARVDSSRVRGGRKVVYKLTSEGWRFLADTLKEKARTKFDVIRFYILEGAEALKRAGMVEDYEEICKLMREGYSKLGEALSRQCS